MSTENKENQFPGKVENSDEKGKKGVSKKSVIKFSIVMVLYLLFLYWVGSWWGLLVVPFIIDAYFTKKINWGWWKDLKNPTARVIMSWVDAIVFALVAIYFINQFFIQNFVIPSSSLEKTLLTGDYLLVSKYHYGPRIPQTPLTMPLTQHTLPVFNCKSYIETPHWDYRRVKGLGDVKLNDIVVFNYPSGDTVVANPELQAQDYYGMAYAIGKQIVQNPIDSSMSLDLQRKIFSERYAAGTAYIKSNTLEFGGVMSRPTDRRENYVKRCVGLPGQQFKIVDDIIYLDNQPLQQPENVQYRYDVKFLQYLDEDTKKELGITNEELNYLQMNAGFPMTAAVKQALLDRKIIEPNPKRSPLAGGEELYPLNMSKDWTTANYGGKEGFWIPKRGGKLKLTLENLPIYERLIGVYEGNQLEVKDGKIFINGQQTDEYTFKMDYYWMMGDNRDNSADSRFWGFVPEDHIVGKPLFIWLSLDPDNGWFGGKIRWNRFFKWVGDIQ